MASFLDRSKILDLIINENSTIKFALSVINQGGIQCCFIEKNNQFTGIVTDSDIRKGLLAGNNLEDSVNLIANKNPVTVNKSEATRNIDMILFRKQFLHIPVLSDSNSNTLIGVFISDILSDSAIQEDCMFIMAGGLGQRLKPLTNNTPKPMLPISGKPILEHILLKAHREGFRNILISVNYLSEQIIDYFKDGSEYGLCIDYIHETTPLGTAGSLGLLPEKYQASNLIVTNGDLLTGLDLREIVNFANKHQCEAVMATKEYEYKSPFGVVKHDNLDFFDIQEKPTFKFNINAGIYYLKPDILSCINSGESLGMNELFSRAKQMNKKIKIFPIHESWIDIGRHEEYQKASNIFSD